MKAKFDIYLQDNDKTREELLRDLSLSFMESYDIPQVAALMAKSIGPNTVCEAFEEVIRTNVIINKSVKIYDPKTDEIYGFLILSNYRLEQGSPISSELFSLAEFLSGFSQIHGYAFILDSRLRGTGLDKKMLLKVNNFVNTFDFCWLGVHTALNTDKYWERFGFRKLFTIEDGTFYGKFSENVKSANIYYKMLFFNSEDHIHYRETGESSN